MLLCLVGVAAVLYLPLISRLNVNWDEFRFLSDIHQYHRGTLASPLQTLHVYMFGWLPRVGQHEIDQIVAGRFVYHVMLLSSCAFIYTIAMRFLTRAGALFAVFAFLSYSAVIVHGTSFRFDGLSIFILLGALVLLVRKPNAPLAIVAAGCLAAVSVMVTLKSMFYLPTFLLVLTLSASGSWRRLFSQALLFTTALIAAFSGLFLLHSSNLQSPSASNPVERVQWAVGTGIRFDDLFPRFGYLWDTMVANPGTWLLILLGVGVLVSRLLRGRLPRRDLSILAMLAPLLSLAIYRNAYPYFFVFLMPLAVIAAGVAFDRLTFAKRSYQMVTRSGMIAVVLAAFALNYSAHAVDETQAQRQLVGAVHRMFPAPVPYVDRNSMIASFPKVGFFMSTWGFERYHSRGRPIFADLLRQAAPRFLIANHPALEIHSDVAERYPYRLMEEDLQVLRENFIPHWGPVYVAGKFTIATNHREVELEIFLPGDYQVLSVGPVYIDGAMHEPGDIVNLQRETITVLGAAERQEVWLKFDPQLYRPQVMFPDGDIYAPF